VGSSETDEFFRAIAAEPKLPENIARQLTDAGYVVMMTYGWKFRFVWSLRIFVYVFDEELRANDSFALGCGFVRSVFEATVGLC
jgi:hypothetical protein